MLFNFKYFAKVWYALLLLGLIILVGTVGFMFIENYTFAEAFYMTIITVSTVGFGEVRELSPEGRIFTSLLIITSFGTFAFAIASITRYLVEGEYKTYFRDYQVNKQITEMRGHTIVCGYGRNGKQACKTLEAHAKKFVVVENQDRMLEQLKENRYIHVVGDATGEENLKRAGIDNAAALITTLPKDADNVFVVLSARQLNPRLRIISRASDTGSDKKLRIAGADNVIMPDKVGGAHMGSLVVTPDVIEFLDHISIQGPAETNLEELTFNEFPPDLQNRSIQSIGEKYATGVSIIGFKTAEGDYIVNPPPETEIIQGSKLFVLGNPEQIQKLNRIFGVHLS